MCAFVIYQLPTLFVNTYLRNFIFISSDGSEPRPGPGSARARLFFRDRARNFEKGPCSTQAWDRFFEKGLENWDFYVVKKEARQGSGSNFCEGPGLGLGSRSIFKARDRPGIDFLGLDPGSGSIF